MGHLPIDGPGGSLELLAPMPIERKIYIHINNTNPILLEDSPERRAHSSSTAWRWPWTGWNWRSEAMVTVTETDGFVAALRAHSPSATTTGIRSTGR